MNDRIKAFAKSIGAEVIAELPDVGHGALGAVQYAGYYKRRMEEVKNHPDFSLSVPVDDVTFHALESITELLWPGEKVGPSQCAAGMIKGMTVVLLKQFLRQMQSPVGGTKKALDMKFAMQEALKAMTADQDGEQGA
jgi:hypothetical protein